MASNRPTSKTPDAFATLDSRLEALTQAIESFNARLSTSMSPEALSEAVATGYNQAKASGARMQAFGRPLPTAQQVFEKGIPTAPLHAHQPNYSGSGGKVLAGLLANRLHNSAHNKIMEYASTILRNPGETLSSEKDIIRNGKIIRGHDLLGPDGTPTGTTYTTGEIAAAVSGINRVHSRTGLAASALQGIASGEGMRGMLAGLSGEGIGAAAPFAAATLAAGDMLMQVGNLQASVRQDLAGYQQDFGGSQIGQFGQIARQKLFGFSNMFGIGDGQAQQLFQGVSALGLNGSNRQNALNTALDLFYRYGMSAANALKLFTTALHNGNTQLVGLVDSIGSVTRAAQAGGISASQAQQNFSNIYSSVTSLVGANQSSGYVSAAMTNALSSMGQMGSGIDLSGLTSFSSLAFLGSQSGMTPEQVASSFASTGANAQQGLSNSQKAIWSLISSYFIPYANIIRNYMAKVPPQANQAAWLPGLVDAIRTADAANQQEIMFNVPNLLSTVLHIQGSTESLFALGCSIAASMLTGRGGFNLASGNTSLSPMALSSSAKKALSVATSYTGSTATSELNNGKLTTSKNDTTYASGNADASLKNLLDATGIHSSNGSFWTGNSPQAAYIRAVSAGGKQRNPVIEALLKNDKHDQFNIDGKYYTANQITAGWAAGYISNAQLDQMTSKRTGNTISDMYSVTSTTVAPGTGPKQAGTPAVVTIQLGPGVSNLFTYTASPSDAISFANNQANLVPSTSTPSNPAYRSPPSPSPDK